MFKYITGLTLLFISSMALGQEIILNGEVRDTQNLPLEAATIYLTNAKDSSLINYTISNKNGKWQLKARKLDSPAYLRISHVGLATYKTSLQNLTKDYDLGTIQLFEDSIELEGIVLDFETPPIIIKSDTLEFNASSFKVRPDANVEALLKQLPGVTFDENGKISINGKEVNQILVEGKPFFDKDGKIALQNLPANVIDKIQVSDTKTKEEELGNKNATGNNASINLTLDKDIKRGIFGKIMTGYGSDKRYETSALINYFKGTTKLSLLASSNNINSSSFSMNDIFDSMGGGRNTSVYTTGDGGFSVNGIQVGGGKGISKTDIVGLNYADTWSKNIDGGISYFYTASDTENKNRTNQVNFLPINPGMPDDTYSTKSTSKTNTERDSHNINSEFNFVIDSTATIYFAPTFSSSKGKINSDYDRVSERLRDSKRLNDNYSYSYNDSKTDSFSGNLVFNKRLNNKGRSFNIVLNNQNQKYDDSNLVQSQTNTYTYVGDDQFIETENRNQQLSSNQKDNDYNAGITYYEPITDSLIVRLNFDYNTKKSTIVRTGLDYDPFTEDYTMFNSSLSSYLESNLNLFNPNAGFEIIKSKFYFTVDGGVKMADFKNSSYYLNTPTNLKTTYVLPSLNLNTNYTLSPSKSLELTYRYNVDFPSANQVLPIEDLRNPLYSYIGNPDVDPNRFHYIYFTFNDYNFDTRSGYSLYFNSNYYENQIVSYSVLDESAKTTTTYKNMDGNLSLWGGFNFNKSLKKEAHNFRYGLGARLGYLINKGYINTELFDSKSFQITPKINFVYEYGTLLTINPSYSFVYSNTDYTNYAVDSESNFMHVASLQTTSYWPKNIVFGNDLSYNYNSQISDGFKKDYFLWNSSIGYTFYKDVFMFKVKVYDLLNQNLGTSRTILPTAVRDEENLVLKRYVMFSLTYKLNNFKRKEDID